MSSAMSRISPLGAWIGVSAIAVVLAAQVAIAAPRSVVPTTPTQQEALDGLEAARLYIQQHPNTPPPTTTTPPLSTDPVSFSATAGDQKIVLSWAKPLGGTPTGYIYGRDGVDNTGYGAYTSPVQPTTTLTATLDKLINGAAYTVFVEAVYTTGNKRVSLVRTPSAAATTPPPTSTSPPANGRPSGLPWSSGVWANGDRVQTQRFITEVRGGRALDNFLVYTWRDSITAQQNPTQWRAGLPAVFDGATSDLILAATTWMGDGASMTQAQGQTLGASLCTIDSTPIVRLDWEMNLNDGPGGNGAMLTASNYNAWVARFRAVATGIKAGCPAVKIDFNPNHGTDQTPGCNTGTYAAPNNCSRRAFQTLKDVVDIFGIDRYDSWPPVTASGAGWSSHQGGFNELDESRAYALANGKKWSLPEWGLWTGANGGGDDPKFIQLYIDYLAAHASDLAYETYFNDPHDYIISDLIDHNPLSRAQYRSSLLAK